MAVQFPRLDGQSEARSRPLSHLRQVTLPNGWREFLWLIRSSIFVISQAVISNLKIMFEAYRRNSYRRVQ
jgi:hypothetical protein